MSRHATAALTLAVLALPAVAPPALWADDRVRLEAMLLGTEADPGIFGRARFEDERDRRRFEARVEAVTQAAVVAVLVDDVFLGGIVLDDQGRGELRLDSQLGDEIPALRAGQLVRIFDVDTLAELADGVLVKD